MPASLLFWPVSGAAARAKWFFRRFLTILNFGRLWIKYLTIFPKKDTLISEQPALGCIVLNVEF